MLVRLLGERCSDTNPDVQTMVLFNDVDFDGLGAISASPWRSDGRLVLLPIGSGPILTSFEWIGL